jgi:hypothetical protein
LATCFTGASRRQKRSEGLFGCSPAEFRRDSRPLKLQSVLTHDDAAEAQKILTCHAAGLGKAAELAVGLSGTGRKQIVLSAPHNASAM